MHPYREACIENTGEKGLQVPSCTEDNENGMTNCNRSKQQNILIDKSTTNAQDCNRNHSYSYAKSLPQSIVTCNQVYCRISHFKDLEVAGPSRHKIRVYFSTESF